MIGCFRFICQSSLQLSLQLCLGFVVWLIVPRLDSWCLWLVVVHGFCRMSAYCCRWLMEAICCGGFLATLAFCCIPPCSCHLVGVCKVLMHFFMFVSLWGGVFDKTCFYGIHFRGIIFCRNASVALLHSCLHRFFLGTGLLFLKCAIDKSQVTAKMMLSYPARCVPGLRQACARRVLGLRQACARCVSVSVC